LIDCSNSASPGEKKKKNVRREDLFNAVNSVAALLLPAGYDNFSALVYESLKCLGQSAKADRVYIWKNVLDQGKLFCTKCVEWADDRFEETGQGETHLAYDDYLPNWRQIVSERAYINKKVEDLLGPLAQLPQRLGTVSVLLLPIILNDDFWGFIGFDDCTQERLFTPMERDFLRTGGGFIATAINHREMTLALTKAKEAAQASTDSKTEFFSRMSHEIRTPINAIIGMTAIAKKSSDPEKTHYCLDQIETASRQLLSVINNVLDMSKIEANRIEIIRHAFDFEKMIHNVFNMVQIKIEEKHQQCVQHIPKIFTRYVISDELRWSQILINLLSNAVKFTPAQGTITLEIEDIPLSESESLLRVEVSDTGIGIPPEQQERIFRSFEQANTEITRQYGGTGLGLAICKKIINLMGGDIRVVSEPHKGSHFIFNVNVSWGETINREPPASQGGPVLPCWKGKTVLIAEDVKINQEVITGILEETGINIEIAGDGLEAVEMFERNPGKYDLILMDIQMPRMDGLEASRRIRSSDAASAQTIPIVAMTANAFEEDVQNCLDAGMNGHIAKPIELEILFSTMSRYLAYLS
jgi:signal transduction histidine kinase/CheY-like chemotaxis protein